MFKQLPTAVLLGASLLVAGCGHKASGQTVAVVNGEEITAGELNAAIASAQLPNGVDKKKATQAILQQIINRRLLAQHAVEQGIDKSPEFINASRQQRESLLIQLAAQRENKSAKLPDANAVNAFIAANPTRFGDRQVLSVDQVRFAAPKTPALLTAMKDDHSMEQLTKRLDGAGITYERGKGRVDTAGLAPDVAKRIEALPAGEPFLVPAGGFVIANVVTGKEPVKTATEEQRSGAVQLMRGDAARTSIVNDVKQLRSAAKITYQPGFQPTAQDLAAATGGTPAAK